MITIERGGLIKHYTEELVLKTKGSFEVNSAVVFPTLLSTTFLESLLKNLPNVSYKTVHVSGIGTQEANYNHMVSKALNLVFSGSEIISFIQMITGRTLLSRFNGRLMKISNGQQLDWHDDTHEPSRRVGLSLSLSKEFTGGEFQIRKKKREEYLFRHKFSVIGEVVFFNLDHDIEHRIMPISSGERIVFTGAYHV